MLDLLGVTSELKQVDELNYLHPLVPGFPILSQLAVLAYLSKKHVLPERSIFSLSCSIKRGKYSDLVYRQ